MRTKSPDTKKEIVNYINDFYRQNLRSPSFQEIGDFIGTSKVTAYRYILEMSEEGSIEYAEQKISTELTKKVGLQKVSAAVVGNISCGPQDSEEEMIEEYVSLPVSLFGAGEYYILRASGDSMVDAGIDEHDLVIIEKNNNPSKGDYIVALDENNESTLKRYDGIENGKAILSYMNETVYPGKKITLSYLSCQGIARHVIKKFR